MTATRHTCNDGNGPVFGRRTGGCPRCAELAAGAAPVRWAPGRRARTAVDITRRAEEIRAHDCTAAGCGPVCTFGDW